jgi:hypothetical protein
LLIALQVFFTSRFFYAGLLMVTLVLGIVPFTVRVLPSAFFVTTTGVPEFAALLPTPGLLNFGCGTLGVLASKVPGCGFVVGPFGCQMTRETAVDIGRITGG